MLGACILQHSPSSVVQAKQLDKVLELVAGQGFGENVGDVVLCWYVMEGNLFEFHSLADEMIPYINVFHVGVELVVFRKGDCRLVVTVKGDRVRDSNFEFAKESPQP